MKNWNHRLKKISQTVNITSRSTPIDVYMHEVGEDEPTGTFYYENGRVHEIHFNTKHPLVLPPGPWKLIRGQYIDV
ncbi:MAG: hypothetical protein ACRC8S_12160 [Fimbriiglobus sp.]